jgi:hypothetical protein
MKASIKKQTIIIVASILFVTTSYAQWGKSIKGNGQVTTVTRNTSEYDGIKCSGSFDYILVRGTEGSIKIEGEENLLEYIITEVKNNNLIVKEKDNMNLRTSWNKSIKITIPFKDINNLSLTGSGDVKNEDLLTSNDLDISLTGSGDIVLNIKSSNTKANVTGSGDVTLKGATNSLKASVTGSGNFNGIDLESIDTDVLVTGSGDAKVVCNGNFKARVAGSGDIQYIGNPKTEDTKVAGSGDITYKRNL